MKNRVNIVIPSIQLSSELMFCLKKLERQVYKNFFVTIVLDKKNFKKAPKFNYKLNICIVGKRNMSFKRNFAAKKYFSNYLAFLDSDTFAHNKWLENAIKIFNTYNFDVIGGPSIPFPNQTFLEKISYYAKRSYFVTGYLNFRKYKAKARLCEWLESCNFFILRKNYLKYGGMNEKKYLGEDKDFFEKVSKKNPNFKTYYHPDLYIYHKERGPLKLILQRFSFGTDLFNIIKFKNNIHGYQPILPMFVFLIFIFLCLKDMANEFKFYLIFSFIFFIEALITLDIIKYVKNFKKYLLTMLVINFSNLAFAFGSLLALFGINKNLIRKIYLKSRNNQ